MTPRPAASLAVALAALVLAPAVPRALADGPSFESLLQQKSQAVVAVKFVLKTSFTVMGQAAQEQESNREVRGVLVDPSGLVMLSNSEFEAPGGMARFFRRQGAEVKSAPSDFKVLFGNEAKEHASVLVARDSTLGLAFVQVIAIQGAQGAAEGAAPAAADLSKGAEPRVGQVLFGVTRKARGFDCAPVIDRLFVSGVVEKPRKMWSVSGAFNGLGLPVYDLATGVPVGVLSAQSGAEGVDEDGGAGAMLAALSGGGDSVFVLPLDAVGKSVEAAKKRAPEAVEKATAAGKEPAKTEPPASEPGMSEPGMSEPGMSGDAPKPPDAPK